jgi:hypothetical protein
LVNAMLKLSIVEEYRNLDELMASLQDVAADSVRQLSRNNWIRVGPNAWLLAAKKTTLMCRQDQDGTYVVEQRIRLSAFGNVKAPYALTKYQPMFSTLSPFTTLKEALHTADQWVRHTVGYMPHVLEWRAAWRQMPATSQQTNLLKQRGLWHSDTWTKGRAADMLTRSFEGVFRGWRQEQRQSASRQKKLQTTAKVMEKRIQSVDRE